MAEVLEHPCTGSRCHVKSWWNADTSIWTKQHGENPEHRRAFTLRELLRSEMVEVRLGCHDCTDEMYKIHYDWLRELHQYEVAQVYG